MKSSRKRTPEPDRAAVSVWVLIQRLWRHCRTRKTVVAMILGACVVETAFFWVVPLRFRSLVDNALGPRDLRHLVVVVTALARGVIVASIGSIQRGRLYAHLQSQIVSDTFQSPTSR